MLAYFGSLHDSPFCVIDRADTEEYFVRHYDRESQIGEPPALYAIRNLVLALGARALFSKSLDYAEVAARSFPFFENALSVFAQIALFRKDIQSAQALIMMVGIILPSLSSHDSLTGPG